MRQRPTASALYFLLLGRAYFFLGDLEQAGFNPHQALARNPANLETHIYLAATLSRLGDQEGAVWEVEEIRALDPGLVMSAWLATYPMTDPAQVEQLATVMGGLAL